MPGPLPSVSVVIPTRDRAQLLQRCLAAVLADAATAEVVVVVDGDDPETSRLLEGLAASEPRLLITSTPAEPADLGRVQRGRDHGVSIAGSEVVLSMDDDVVAHPSLVSGHARRHTEADDVVVVGYMPVVTPRRWPKGHSPITYYAAAYAYTCEEYVANPGSILRNLWGGNVSVRRSHWLQAIEGPRVGSYLDDKELGLVLHRQGLRGIFDPSLRADHFYERSLRGLVRRSEMNAVAQAGLRAAYPEGLATPDPEEGPTMRLMLRLTRSDLGWLAVRWGLIGLTSTAAALRVSGVEDKGVGALSRLAFTRAAEKLPDTVG